LRKTLRVPNASPQVVRVSVWALDFRVVPTAAKAALHVNAIGQASQHPVHATLIPEIWHGPRPYVALADLHFRVVEDTAPTRRAPRRRTCTHRARRQLCSRASQDGNLARSSMALWECSGRRTPESLGNGCVRTRPCRNDDTARSDHRHCSRASPRHSQAPNKLGSLAPK